MKNGNDLVKPKKYKVFVYMDSEFPEGNDNVFISGVYKSVKEFKKMNDGMNPIISYDAEHLIQVLQTQIDELNNE